VLAVDLLNKIKAAPDFESDPISSKPNRLLAILEDEGHPGTARPPLGVSHDFQEVLSSVAVAGVDELLYESLPLRRSFATTLHPFLHFTIDHGDRRQIPCPCFCCIHRNERRSSVL